MADQGETVAQPADELTALRRRVGELEAAAAEHRRAEHDLRLELERLRIVEGVVAASPDGVAVVDRQYVYRTVNLVYVGISCGPWLMTCGIH